MSTDIAYLICEDGPIFTGRAWGARGIRLGVLTFDTRMTGYQAVLSAPEYADHIVVMTAPHIGNVGINDEAPTQGFTLAGLVAREPARRASNWRSTGDFTDLLVREGVVGISGIDTRALTLHIRDNKGIRGAIVSGDALPMGAAQLTDEVRAQLSQILTAAMEEQH
ncbi:carbamoyl-phosphate synthase domain-containing protein [Schaalia sp. Marseille-Q2122]|uniref:carbamoyl-phosphate synthase domain-containing protein n=1 Tax=Schaalia sp. Marseille-Q2122 TaxID=2736604 RepID=UPI00158F54B9|nr:carbamoyl-phosphate synthase domain-containing protein [Schaalia sp. Marseille-Q2122]